MTRAAILLALAFTTLACGDKGDDISDDDGGIGGDSGDDGGDDGGDEGGGDEGGGDEGGGDEGGGDEGSGGDSACSNLFPIDRVGDELDYEYTASDIEGGYSMTYVGQESFGGETAWRVNIESHIENLSSDYIADSTTASWYRCDEEGVWLLGQDFEQIFVYSDSSSSYWSEVRYPEPGLVAPLVVGGGDFWTYEFVSVTVDSNGGDSVYEGKWTYVVSDDTEPVVVPAGTFEAWTLSYTLGGSTHSHQAADGVGLVKAQDVHLVEVRF